MTIVNPLMVEESDDERSIATPDLRLRFRWAGDRWRHSLEIRPGPWQVVADSVEGGTSDLDSDPRPTYQDLHFDRHGDGLVALALGQAGSHHFSAAFRVTFRAWRQPHFEDGAILQDRSISLVEIDVADRTRRNDPPEARYLVHQPPVDTFLGDTEDYDDRRGFSPKWRDHIVWEASVPGNYDVALMARAEPVASRCSIVARTPSGAYLIRIGPEDRSRTGTHRFGYAWSHHRVHAFRRAEGAGEDPPWSLAGCADPRMAGAGPSEPGIRPQGPLDPRSS